MPEPAAGRTGFRPSNIALVGFMGAGKTTVGQAVARALGMDFVDTDTLVEEAAGAAVSAIFAEQGEPEFRRLEAAVVQEAARQVGAGQGKVIATGGGAVADGQTLATLKRHCLVIWLDAPFPTMLQRAVAGGQRPLLAGPEAAERAEQLYQERQPLYAQAHAVVAAAASDAAVAQIVRLWRGLPRQADRQVMQVHTGQRDYAIHTGSWLLPDLPAFIPGPAGRALVVADSNVAPLYGKQVAGVLRHAGWTVEIAVFPAGEEHKNLDTLRDLYAACAAARLDRGSFIVAVGGGVTGDIAGLLAATWLRGIPLVQVPTTLLAQVDASLGGKVAVDLPEGKNLVGAFYQPWAVVADTSSLLSLPRRQLLSGLVEVIKHGAIADIELFAFVEENLAAILQGDQQALAWCVERSCAIKGAVVAEDEREAGLREILNFGHTTAHAIETVTGYTAWTHGEAVAAGMVVAARLSQACGLPAAAMERLAALLERAGLPAGVPDLPPAALLDAMYRDKKTRHGQLRFVLLPRLGAALAGQPLATSAVLAALSDPARP